MNRFCLVILTGGGTFEVDTCVQGQRYISHFVHCVNILCDRLCLAVDTELADTTWKVQDPACSILEGKPKFGFSIVAQESFQQQLQSLHADKSVLFGGTKWHNLSSNKHALSQPGDVVLQMMTVIQPCQPRDEESEVEHLAEQVHQLADLLPVPEGVPLNVYWIVAGKTPDIGSRLPLFGALKRLKEWHGAHITPVCNQQFDRDPFVKSWGKFLSLSIIDVTSLELHLNVHLDAVWHGSIVFEKKNSRLVLPGFKLLLDRRQTRGCSLKAVEVHLENGHDKERCNKPDHVAEPFLGCEMQILDIVEKSSVLLHMFLPLKLKLRLHSSSQKKSNQLMDWFSRENNTDVALIGCLSFESASSKRHEQKDREAWISHIKSSGSSSAKQAGSCAVERNSKSMSRLCMLCGDARGGVDVFILRPAEQLDGRLLDSLAVIASSCSIAMDSSKGSFCFLDLTDSLATRESLVEQNQLQLIQGELERQKAKETRDTDMRCSELIELITTARLRNFRELREKPVIAQQVRQLNVPYDSVIQVKSEFSVSPSSWPERLWLRQSDSSAQEDGKTDKTTEAAKSVSCFDIRDILKKFQSDGRPVRDDLSPVMPAAGGGASEGYVRINTSFDVIRRTTYPESLRCRFHGVEYCLDMCDALKKDAELVNVQKSVIKSETVSTCVEAVSNTRKPSTQPRVRSGGMSTRQKSRLARGITRKRPLDTDKVVKQRGVPQTRSSSKATKRKRKNTEEDKDEKDAADTMSQETRSQRHQRRLKQVVDVALKNNGVDHTHDLHKSCSERLFRVCKSFLKDLSSSHGLNEEMKRLSKSNVEQVIAFESKRLEKKRHKK